MFSTKMKKYGEHSRRLDICRQDFVNNQEIAFEQTAISFKAASNTFESRNS